jgi:hypothetical protein
MAASQPQIGPQLMTATTNSKHSCGQLPPYCSRNYHSPVPRCLYTAIPLRGDLPYVSGPLRLQVFLDLSPPGSKATSKMVAERFVWPGMQSDCRIWDVLASHTRPPNSPDTQLLHWAISRYRQPVYYTSTTRSTAAPPTNSNRQSVQTRLQRTSSTITARHTHYTLWAPFSLPCAIHHLSSHLRGE